MRHGLSTQLIVAYAACLAPAGACANDVGATQQNRGGNAGIAAGNADADATDQNVGAGGAQNGGGGATAQTSDASLSGGSAGARGGADEAAAADAGAQGDSAFDSSVAGGSVRVNLPKDVIYASLGDSITNGWNAGVTCQDWPSTPQPFPGYCATGNSYVVDVARGLTASGHMVSVVNPAQPSKRIGYVIKVELSEVPSNANVVSLYIGTNDWRDIADAGSEQAIQDAMRAFELAFDGVIADIAKKAPTATIVLLNVPNQQFVNEGHPADQLDRYGRVSVELDKWINAHADKYVVIDNVCDPRTYQKEFRGSNVHPNTAGHQLIADRFLTAMSGQSAPLPAKSCPPYLTP